MNALPEASYKNFRCALRYAGVSGKRSGNVVAQSHAVWAAGSRSMRVGNAAKASRHTAARKRRTRKGEAAGVYHCAIAFGPETQRCKVAVQLPAAKLRRCSRVKCRHTACVVCAAAVPFNDPNQCSSAKNPHLRLRGF